MSCYTWAGKQDIETAVSNGREAVASLVDVLVEL